MKKSIFAVVAITLLVVACVKKPTPEKKEPAPLAVSSNEEKKAEVRETKNVIYQGVVKPAGISIYQQGSHRLQLENGKFILLESDSVDLNGYVGEHVEMIGAVKPTVEEGGMIMRVESAKLIVSDDEYKEETDESEESEDGESDESEKSEDGEADESEDKESDESDESEDGDDDDKSSDSSDSSETSDFSSEVQPITAELTERIRKMANESFTPDQWTQEYCTAHIGFCIPVHRNWWFKSFGTTSSLLWHIELSSEELGDLYSGPIHVNLVSGSIGSSAKDGQIKQKGPNVVGYRSWTDGRHFEITAPVTLEGAVRYIMENLDENE